MRILVEVTHPAQVHLFKHAVTLWQRRGHRVLVASRDKDCLLELLNNLGIAHVCLSRRRRGLLGLGWEMLERDWQMLRLLWNFRPDVVVGRITIAGAQMGFLTGRPVVLLEDTEHARLQQRLSLPFATVVCTNAGYRRNWGPRHVRFAGIEHLAYLHPKYFTPDPEVRSRAGLSPDEPYIVLRLVSWEAAHDIGQEGLKESDIAALMHALQPHGRIFISAERSLPARWTAHRIRLPASDMLNLLAFARIYVGEGGSMASEAACLGTPAVFVNRLRVGYLEWLENRYGLVRNVSTLRDAVAAAQALLAVPPPEYAARRQQLLRDTCDVTEFIVDIVERAGRGERTQPWTNHVGHVANSSQKH